jgi:3-oxoacyl-[acyl-carrier-protein] synthase II
MLPPDIWITGVGLVCALGGTAAAAEAAIFAGAKAQTRPLIGSAVVPAAPVEIGRYMPNRVEQKRLGGMQTLGICAAGDALSSAGLLGEAGILASAAVLVGAMGGERDAAFDRSVLGSLPDYADSAALNHRLVEGTRPSLFLSQLPNLLAGNISILFGIAGRSRTMIGEEQSGIAALQEAARMLAAGRADVALAGGSFTAEREDLLWFFQAAGTLWRGAGEPPPLPLRGGMVLGSAAAFLVLERAEHATRRGAVPLARLAGVALHHERQRPDGLAAWLAEIAAVPADAIVSAASGAMPAMAEELAALPTLPKRHTAALAGHAMEASFPLALGLAALALRRGELWPARLGDPAAVPAGPLGNVLVAGIGHRLGEGYARLERVGPTEAAR